MCGLGHVDFGNFDNVADSYHTNLYVNIYIVIVDILYLISNYKLMGLNKKLRLERIEVYLNCKRIVRRDMTGRFKERMNFLEGESEAFVIKKVDD
jgi:hypothetical protein